MMHANAIAVALVLTCSAADRVIGWGKWGRTKPVLVAALVLALIAFLMGLPPVAVATFPIAFLIWRTPGWHLLGGSINPAPNKALGTFARHALALAFCAPAYWGGVSVPITAACMVAFAAVATALGVWNYFNKAHANQTIETLRGLALGTALAVAFVYLRAGL